MKMLNPNVPKVFPNGIALKAKAARARMSTERATWAMRTNFSHGGCSTTCWSV